MTRLKMMFLLMALPILTTFVCWAIWLLVY